MFRSDLFIFYGGLPKTNYGVKFSITVMQRADKLPSIKYITGPPSQHDYDTHVVYDFSSHFVAMCAGSILAALIFFLYVQFVFASSSS